MTARQILLGWLCALLFCSCTTKPTASPGLPADVTLNRNAGCGDWIYIPIKLESGEILPFVLDTGSPWTLFENRYALHLGQSTGAVSLDNFGVTQTSKLYPAPKLFSGRTQLQMDAATVKTFATSQLASPRHPVAGILGMDVLKNYCLQLDFKAGKIRFLDSLRADKKSWGWPFALNDIGNGCFMVDENFVGIAGTGSEIDTGDDYDGWLTPSLFQQWTNSPATDDKSQTHSPTGILGGEIYTDLRLDVTTEKTVLKSTLYGAINGIGLHALSRNLVTFDFPNQTLYLKRTSDLPLWPSVNKAVKRKALKSAMGYLIDLRKQGRLPGWSKADHSLHKKDAVTVTFHNGDPFSATFDHMQKMDGVSIYHYELIRQENSWKLSKAWRTDQNNHVLEKYSVP